MILKRFQNGLLIKAKGCHLSGRELEIDCLILRANEFNFTGIGYSQNFRAYIFRIITQLPHRQPIRSEGKDIAKNIAELVVVIGTIDAFRHVWLYVVEHMTHFGPGFCDLFLANRILQKDKYDRLACRGDAACIIECVEFFELLLDTIRNLIHRFIDGCARPVGLHHHRLHGKFRIFRAP